MGSNENDPLAFKIRSLIDNHRGTKRNAASSPEKNNSISDIADELLSILAPKLSTLIDQAINTKQSYAAATASNTTATKQSAARQTTSLSQQATLSIKSYKSTFEGANLQNFKGKYLEIQSEIGKNKGDLPISNAFINDNNQLIIKTTDENAHKKLTQVWNDSAFTSGVTLVVKEPKFFAAIRHVDLQLDVSTLKETLLPKGIIDIIRIIKKKDNKPLQVCKLVINSQEKFNELLANGLHIGATRFRVEEWNGPPPISQCHKCQKLGHHSKNCTSPHHICPICTGQHSLKDCTNRANEKCANCGGSHTAFSKQCPIIAAKQNLPKHPNNPPKTPSHFTQKSSTLTTPKPSKPAQQPLSAPWSVVKATLLASIGKAISAMLTEMINSIDKFNKKTADKVPYFTTLLNDHFNNNNNASELKQLIPHINLNFATAQPRNNKNNPTIQASQQVNNDAEMNDE